MLSQHLVSSLSVRDNMPDESSLFHPAYYKAVYTEWRYQKLW